MNQKEKILTLLFIFGGFCRPLPLFIARHFFKIGNFQKRAASASTIKLGYFSCLRHGSMNHFCQVLFRLVFISFTQAVRGPLNGLLLSFYFSTIYRLFNLNFLFLFFRFPIKWIAFVFFIPFTGFQVKCLLFQSYVMIMIMIVGRTLRILIILMTIMIMTLKCDWCAEKLCC